LKGIHQSMAVRLAKLLRSIEVEEGVVLMTGGLALDTGLVAALNEAMIKEQVKLVATSHPDSIYAGAVGAALWGGYRYEKLLRMQTGEVSPEVQQGGVLPVLAQDVPSDPGCAGCSRAAQ
jgi:benzoyl-CoA reductase subunit D